MIRMADVTRSARSTATRAARVVVGPGTAPVWLTAGSLAIALVAITALGGLGQAESTPIPLAAGDTARTSLYSVTVVDASTTDEIEAQYLSAEPGEKLLVVTVQLENLSDRPVGLGRSADRVESRLVDSGTPLIELADVVPTRSAQAWRADGSAGSVYLQPNVPGEVTIAWSVPEDAFADGVVRIDVHDATVSTGQVILSADNITWRRTELLAQITANVTEAP